MAECSMGNCNEAVIGGFQQIIPAGHMLDPYASIPGPRTFWCQNHERSGQASVIGKHGEWLSQRNLG
jgi:hypothetical protein